MLLLGIRYQMWLSPNFLSLLMESYYSFLLLGTLIPLALTSPATSMIMQNNFSDSSALLAFKEQVDDPRGILAANWTANTSVCFWVGVSCHPRRQRVVALHLNGFFLGGSLSPRLGNLSSLFHLDLGNNTLHGPIPGDLSRLPHLARLILQDNQLSGPIPSAIFNMSSLRELTLGLNNLSGPPFPTNRTLVLPRLRHLSLQSNQLTGAIPQSLGSCYQLQQLSLSDNQFSGTIPAELGNLAQLNLLHLGRNHLTGTIPASLSNLTNLNELVISNNNLHEEIPMQLGNLRKLEVLALHQNNLTGDIPLSLSNATALFSLELYSNYLTGSLPNTFGNMPLLELLNLNHNLLTGRLQGFIGSLSNCRVLVHLQIAYNQLEGSLPESVGNLSQQLQEIAVNANQMKGVVPAGLGNLSGLICIDLSHNEFSGMIPLSLFGVERMQVIYMHENRLEGPIPHEIGLLKSLSKILIQGNRLFGPIPESLGNISGLRELWFADNALSSTIPKSIWTLRDLLALNFSRNFLKGSLPPQVGNLKVIATMDLSANRLSGSIPSEFGDVLMMHYLNLSHNSFQSDIPQSLGQMVSIETLDLSSNALSGVIPRSLADLRYLSSLNLSFNRFVGQVPDGGAFTNLTIGSLIGNTALCRGASHLGFPPCSANATSSNPRKPNRSLIIHILIVFVALVACLCLVFAFWWKKRTRPDSDAHLEISSHDYRLITYYELARATDNFSDANLLGQGSYGTVFKGFMNDGLLVAVKVLVLDMEGISSSFDTECRSLGMVRHRNLVKIINICSRLDFKALILQYIPNGSLERWLYSHNYCLSLIQRLNIMLDVALAMEYLHHHHFPAVVHCDLKPSNILLDDDMTARVADFGIAKLLPVDSVSSVSTTTLGTIGYIAPEYGSTGRVSRRGDVYSYGILILEIITRKRPSDAIFVGESSLRQWACDAYPTAVMEIVDQNLLRDESDSENMHTNSGAKFQCLVSIIELGLLCSKDVPKERLLMKDVVFRLGKIKSEYRAQLHSLEA